MDEIDLVNNWLESVWVSHSGSKGTADYYRRQLKAFCDFIGKTPQQILEDYEDSPRDRDFRVKYKRYLLAYISSIKDRFTPSTVGTYVAAIKSFFKHSELPRLNVQVARFEPVYHNRDITREEIAQIIAYANLRDKAFFVMMAQSGLRPSTLCHLRYEHIQKEFEAGKIPMKIDIPRRITKGHYGSYFTFVGPETVRFLKLYLNTRPHLKLEDPLFTQNRSNKPVDRRYVSKTFRRILGKLERREVIKIRQRKYRKPAELRLYNLRKFFRKYAGQAGFEYVQYWMGHVVKAGADEHYRPKDPEFHRKLYAEKAMPYLRIGTATPNETEHTIKHLEQTMEKLRQENLELKQRLNGFTLSSDQVQELLRRIEKLEKQAEA